MQNFEEYFEERKNSKFSMPRILARFTFLTNLGYLLYYINSSEIQNARPLVAFYFIRVIFIFVATVLNWARYGKRFYFPLLREMSENLYWLYVLLILLLIRLPFIRQFEAVAKNPFLGLLHLSSIVFVVGFLMMSFQSRFWAKSSQREREKKIKNFRSKAGLNKQEYESLRPYLIESALRNEKTPWAWRIMLVLFSLLLAATITAMASDFVDVLVKWHIISPSNLLPPF